MLRNICLDISYQEITLKLWNLTKLINNSKLYDVTKAEINPIHSYELFKNHEKAQFDKQKKAIYAPQGYHKI